MLGNTGEEIRAGINFEADTTRLQSATKALDSLKSELRDTSGTALAFAEATSSAERSVDDFNTSNASAIATLNSLQAQMAANSAASQTYKKNIEDLGDEMRTIDGIEATIGDLKRDGNDGAIAVLKRELQSGIEEMDEQELSFSLPKQHSRTIKNMKGTKGLSQQNNIVDFLTDPDADSLDITSPISDQVEQYEDAQEKIESLSAKDDEGIFADTIEAMEEVPTMSEVLKKRIDGDRSDDIPIQDLPLGRTLLKGSDYDNEFAEPPFSYEFLTIFNQDGADPSISEILQMPDDELAQKIGNSDAGFVDDLLEKDNPIREFRKNVLDVFGSHQGEHFGSQQTIEQLIESSNMSNTAGRSILTLSDAFEQNDIHGVEQMLSAEDSKLRSVMRDALISGDVSDFRRDLIAGTEGPPMAVKPRSISDRFGDDTDRDRGDIGLAPNRFENPLVDTESYQQQELLSALRLTNTKAHGQSLKNQRPLSTMKNVLDDFFLKDGDGIRKALTEMNQNVRAQLTGGGSETKSQIDDEEVEKVIRTLVNGTFNSNKLNKETKDALSRQTGIRGALKHAMPMVSPGDRGEGQSSLGDFGDMVKADPEEYLGDEFFEQFMKLGELMDESEEISNAVMNSSSVDDAIRRLENTTPGRALQLEQWAEKNKGQFQGIFDRLDLERMLDEDVAKTTGDLRKKIMNQFNRGEGSPIGNMNSGGIINHNQAEMLGNLMRSTGKQSDIGLTQESAQLGLIQEMVDADNNSSRYNDAEDLLRRMMMPKDLAPSVRVGNSVFDYESVTTGNVTEGIEAEIGDMLKTDNEGKTIADYVGQELLDGTKNYSLFELLSDDQDTPGASDVVSQAYSNSPSSISAADKNEVRRTTEALEQVLPDIFQSIEKDSALGMQAVRNDTGTPIRELMPGSDITDFQEYGDADDEDMSQIYDRYNQSFEQFKRKLRSNIDMFNEEQEARPIGLGMSTNQIPGLPNGAQKRRGALSGLMRMGHRVAESQDYGKPRHIRKVNNAIIALKDNFERLNPLLEANSFNLGMFNVRMENIARMLFKISAMLGPIISLLGGAILAVGALTAALGSLVAVGAVDFLEEMENSMAGVANKGDAAKEIMSTIKDMSLEAVAPLRNVQVGGNGPGGMEVFVGMIRGLLVLLNRFADVMATVLESPALLGVLEDLSDWALLDDGDEELANDLRDALETMLPFVQRVISAIVGGLVPAFVFFANSSSRFGDALLTMLGNIGSLLQLFSAYGSGFLSAIFYAVAGLTYAIGLLVSGLDWLLDIIPGVEANTNSFAYVAGALIGTLVILIKTVMFVVPILAGLAAVFEFVTGATITATLANKAYVASLYQLAAAAVPVVIALAQFVIILYAIVRGLTLVIDGILALVGLETIFYDINSAGEAIYSTLAGISLLLLGIAGAIIATVPGISLATVATYAWATAMWAVSGSLLAIKGALLGVIATLSLPIVLAIALGAAIAAVVYHLHKTKSPLLTMEYWSSKIKDTWERIVGLIQKAADYIPGVDGPLAEEDERFQNDESLGFTDSSSAQQTNLSDRRFTDDSGASQFNIRIENDSIDDREFARKIQREFEKLWDDKMGPYLP